MIKYNNMVAKTLFGLEDILAKEIKEIGGKNIKTANRAVLFSGDQELLYKSNLWLRTAISILIPIDNFIAQDPEELYKSVYKIQWDKYFSNSKSILVESVVNSKFFTHSQYVALKTKDAIVDFFRDNTGKRPFVERNNPDIRININISNDSCKISLNTSGATLNRRGYREISDIAPINEVLAAGMIKMSGWNMKSNFIDPMCGSGTIAIEAAMIAKNIAPNLYRKSFSFMHFNDFKQDSWNQLVEEAKQKTKPFTYKILAYDKSPKAFRISRDNIAKAKLIKDIRVFKKSFEEIDGLNNSIIITNPPYGERISNEDTNELYKTFEKTLIAKFYQSSLWVISGHLEALKSIDLKKIKDFELYNGQIKCIYRGYKIVQV